MDNGQLRARWNWPLWATRNGKRKTENGKLKTESGKLKTENGKRKTENGKWKMASGKREMENGMQGDWTEYPLMQWLRGTVKK